MDWGKIWIEQCEAARGIEDEHGTQQALEYLVGEKFINFIEAADDHASFRAEIQHLLLRSNQSLSVGNLPSIWRRLWSQSHSIPTCLSQDGTRYSAKRKSNSTPRKLKRYETKTFDDALVTCCWSNVPESGCWKKANENIISGSLSPTARVKQCKEAKNNYLRNRTTHTLPPFCVTVERWKSVRISRWGVRKDSQGKQNGPCPWQISRLCGDPEGDGFKGEG
jgi:hypothetical protein